MFDPMSLCDFGVTSGASIVCKFAGAKVEESDM